MTLKKSKLITTTDDDDDIVLPFVISTVLRANASLGWVVYVYLLTCVCVCVYWNNLNVVLFQQIT
jgi:hypothetical protein